jgi:hypothetical protein
MVRSGEALSTVTPRRCTSVGSVGWVRVTRFCTCTWALSRSVPRAKRDGQGQLAVGGRLGRHVEHALDTRDGLFQRGRDGFADDFGVGTREAGAHHHRRRHHLGIFADRQLEQRDGTTDQDDQRQHRGEDRPWMKNWRNS